MATMSRWQRTIVDQFGNIAPGASVEVRREIAGMPLQPLYSDRAGTVPMANPFTADSEGFAAFYCIGGAYQIIATMGSETRTWRYEGIGTASEFDYENLLVGLDWKDAWLTATLYTTLQGVRHQGTAYICIADHTSDSTNRPGAGANWTTYWKVLAERGADEFEWAFDNATASADPGTGELRLNNAAFASVTSMYISELCNEYSNPSMATWLATCDDSLQLLRRSIIVIRNILDRSNYAIYYCSGALTDNGTWDTIPLTHITSNGSMFANGARLSVSILRTADPATELCWAFSTTTTNADPGPGIFRFNNAAPASVTQIYLDDACALATGTDISNWPLTWDDSSSAIKGYLTIQQDDVPGNCTVYAINSLVDNAGYTTLNVTYVTHIGSLFTNTARCSFSFSRVGDRGNIAGIRWSFSTTTTMADPTAGFFRLNNATVASATAMALSVNIGEAGNPSVKAFIDTWDDSTSTGNKAYLQVTDANNPATFAIFAITGTITDNTTWEQLPLSYIAGNGAFSNNSVFCLAIFRIGNIAVASGDVVGPGSAVAGNLARYSGTTGKIIDDSGVAVSTSTALGTSNALLPTQNAVKSYVDTAIAAIPSWAIIMKTSDEARTTNTTLTNDSTLTVPVLANTNYRIKFRVVYTAGATEDFKYAITGPTSPTFVSITGFDSTTTAAAVARGFLAFGTSTALTGGGTTAGFIDVDVVLRNGANAGNVTLQWAQNTSGGNACTVLAGSFIEYKTF